MSSWTHVLRLFCLVLLTAVLRCDAPCGAQSVTQVGLRAVGGQGRFRSLKADAAGNLYTLLDAADGLRVVKMDAAATQVLAEAHLGQAGDQAVALALDPAGNVYVTGTSLSTGSLTGTAGTSFPSRADTTTSSFLARFTPALTEQWLTFLGSGRMAAAGVDASATQVVVVGSIFAASLPVTSGGIQQKPLPQSGGNGFVESFQPATGTLVYATYLSGANGDTQPAGIALDGSNNAYVAGTTSATGFPTLNALVPLLLMDAAAPVSGFLSKLTPAGDGFVFSTYVPGAGLTAVAYDATTPSVLLSGNIAPGLFPLTAVRAPIAAQVAYQSAVRMPLDGSAVTSSTLLAPGENSAVAPASGGFVAGVATESGAAPPLLPVAPPQSQGSAFLLVADAAGTVQRTARAGGIPVNNAGFSSLPASSGGVLALADGGTLLAGGVAPTLSSSLRTTQRFDLALGPTATSALPSSVRDALPPATCTGSACAGGAAALVRLAASTQPSLLLSVDALPNVVLRNVGGTQATGLQITVTGFTERDSCGTELPAGSECDLALSGSGPGTLTVRAGNATTASATLPANALVADPLSVVPRELDFGFTAAASPRTRTLTVTNLSTTPQTFPSRAALTASRYALAESASTCTPVGDGVSKVLQAGSACTITLQLAASASAANDGAVRAAWTVGSRDLAITGYTQASSLSLSATHLGFGRQYASGLRAPRYLYLSNGSDLPRSHAAVALSPSSPFQLFDGCPSLLAPQSVCRITVAYASPTVPSSDAYTVNVDGTDVLLDGQTVPQPGVTGAAVNPNLAVSPTAVSFAQPVVVTTVSSETQSVTIRNTGAADFPLAVSVTGDFTASSCPATLPGGATCTVTLRFTPADAGARQGLLSVTAGSASPVYVSLSGTGTAFLAVSGVVAFGEVPVQVPAVRWVKVGQSFAAITVASSSPDYRVLLVEDQGYGYGAPSASRFQQTVSGGCLNCYLGIQFQPTQAGASTATLAISSTSGGATQTIALSGTGVPATGVLLSPATLDFGAVPVSSSTGPSIFTLTNATASPVTTAAPVLQGDFVQSSAATGGTACGGSLQPGESCSIAIAFQPGATGPRTGSVTVSTSAGDATAVLRGYGDNDPGLRFRPGSLFFRNVPGAESTRQTLTITNTGTGTATVGTPTSNDGHFLPASTCAALAAGASCTVTVTYTPGTTLASGLLSLPVTTTPGGASQTAVYTLQLSGLYTQENAGLQIVPGEESNVHFGAVAVSAVSGPRVFRINNLSGKPLVLTLEAPRQFPIAASNCGGLAAGASCTVTVVYAPVLNADATGTLFVQGRPTDGSATVNGLAYLQGYGNATGTLSVTGNLNAQGVLDFGLVASGQSSTQQLVVTNGSSAATVTLRRVRAELPFQAQTDCGAQLAPKATCNLKLTYAPTAQVAAGASTASQDNTGVLTLEADAANSPLLVNLAGRTTPTTTNGAPAPSPLAVLTPSQGALTFSGGAVGSATASQTVVVTNTGTVAVTVRGVVASPDFTATTNCGALPAGAACQVNVAFTPRAAGVRSGSVQIQSDASNALEYVSLLGTAEAANVTLTPVALDFGQVLVGKTSPAQTATLTNTGATPVVLGSIAATGDFAVVSPSGTACASGGTLAPGTACAIGVAFTPSQTGTRTATLSVASSATALPLSTQLSGVGVQPQLQATPATLNFGDVLIGQTQTLAVTLTNVSSSAVNALRIAVSAGDFGVAGTCGPVTLNAGSSCSLNVTFTPTQIGVRTATLVITSSDPASPLSIPLSGNGLQGGSFTLTVNGGSTASATVPYGVSATYALALTPVNGFAGNVALTCAPQSVVQYTTCSIAPSTVMLANGTVNATATITTVTAVGAATASPFRRDLSQGLACFLLPCVLCLVRRRSVRAALLCMLVSAAMLTQTGCGGGSGDPRIRYAAAGTYQFVITASSTSGVTASRSVSVSLTINPTR